MLGGEPVQRAAYRPSRCSSSSGSRRQLRPVSTTGTRGGPGVQSTGSPIGWPNSFTGLTGQRLDRGWRGGGAGEGGWPGGGGGRARGGWAPKPGSMPPRPPDPPPPPPPAPARPHEPARRWLASLADRPVSPRADADTIAAALGRELPAGSTPA